MKILKFGVALIVIGGLVVIGDMALEWAKGHLQ